jgi:hypothetical protein
VKSFGNGGHFWLNNSRVVAPVLKKKGSDFSIPLSICFDLEETLSPNRIHYRGPFKRILARLSVDLVKEIK